MEHELQLEENIPLSYEYSYTYEGIAHNGQDYYVTLPQYQSIHIYDEDFCFVAAFACTHAYNNICYDRKHSCFWANDYDQEGMIYCLDLDLNEINQIVIENIPHIVGMTYHTEDDTLLLLSTHQIMKLTREGQVIETVPLLSAPYHAIMIYQDKIALLRSMDQINFLDILTKQGDILESFAMDSINNVKDISLSVDDSDGDDSFVLLSVNEDQCPCLCKCKICKCDDNKDCVCECITHRICNLLSSIACMEASLSHILNAEGEKIQKAAAMTNDICELLEVNHSVSKTMNDVMMLEQLLYSKLIAVKELAQILQCQGNDL